MEIFLFGVFLVSSCEAVAIRGTQKLMTDHCSWEAVCTSPCLCCCVLWRCAEKQQSDRKAFGLEQDMCLSPGLVTYRPCDFG